MSTVKSDGWGKGFLGSYWHYYKDAGDDTAICGAFDLAPKKLHGAVPKHRRHDGQCSCCKGRSSNKFYTELRLNRQGDTA